MGELTEDQKKDLMLIAKTRGLEMKAQREHQEHATGVIINASTEVRALNTLMMRWRDDEDDLTTYGMAMLIQRSAAKLEKACWCDLTVCCAVHDRHVDPHQHCELR